MQNRLRFTGVAHFFLARNMGLQHHFWSTMRPPRDQLDGIVNGKAVGLRGSSERRLIPEVSAKHEIPRKSDDLHCVSQCFPTPISDMSKT